MAFFLAKIPKSTLSGWCNSVSLSQKQREKIAEAVRRNCKKGTLIAWKINKERRQKYLDSIVYRNRHLVKTIRNKDVCKIALAILYLGEGTKGNKGSLRFGNSDPFVIDLFLNLIKKCYNIDERKLRCTILCRADQNIKKLESFWSEITKIPPDQFYKTRIDPRTIGKPSKKPDYKGVCVIDYFSADVFLDLIYIPKIIHKFGPVAQW